MNRDIVTSWPRECSNEVVSEGSEAHERDYVTKRQEYLVYGLREYWIVDPYVRRITVPIRHGDTGIERVFGEGTIAQALVLPSFAVPVSELLASLDEDEAPTA